MCCNNYYYWAYILYSNNYTYLGSHYNNWGFNHSINV
jgi:hypothetical protein